MIDFCDSLTVQILVVFYKLFPGSAHMENLALLRMKAEVLSVLPLRELVMITLKYGLSSFVENNLELESVGEGC